MVTRLQVWKSFLEINIKEYDRWDPIRGVLEQSELVGWAVTELQIMTDLQAPCASLVQPTLSSSPDLYIHINTHTFRYRPRYRGVKIYIIARFIYFSLIMVLVDFFCQYMVVMHKHLHTQAQVSTFVLFIWLVVGQKILPTWIKIFYQSYIPSY